MNSNTSIKRFSAGNALIVLLLFISCVTVADNDIHQENGMVIPREIYNKTVKEVELIVNDLNIIVDEQDFQKWKKYLSQEYSKFYSNPMELRKLAEELKEKGYYMNLHTLEDYFYYIFIPSHQNLRVDEIIFLDENTVKVIMKVKEINVIIYYLVKIGEEWKIAKYEGSAI